MLRPVFKFFLVVINRIKVMDVLVFNVGSSWLLVQYVSAIVHNTSYMFQHDFSLFDQVFWLSQSEYAVPKDGSRSLPLLTPELSSDKGSLWKVCSGLKISNQAYLFLSYWRHFLSRPFRVFSDFILDFRMDSSWNLAFTAILVSSDNPYIEHY